MTEYKTIAESNNFIILDKYNREWMVAENYQSEADLERDLIQDLENQGYEFRKDLKSQEALLANVRVSVHLQTLNNVELSDGEWLRFVETFLDKPSVFGDNCMSGLASVASLFARFAGRSVVDRSTCTGHIQVEVPASPSDLAIGPFAADCPRCRMSPIRIQSSAHSSRSVFFALPVRSTSSFPLSAVLVFVGAT